MDYRRLNSAIIQDTYQLPRINDSIDSLGEPKLFTALDELGGYWQVPIKDKNKDETTLTFYLGTYRNTRTMFGLQNAPAKF